VSDFKLLILLIQNELICFFHMKNKSYNRIKAVLAEQEKTNIWLAEKLGMNKTTVSKWCTNTMQPTVETLFQIAKALDVDVSELLVKSKK